MRALVTGGTGFIGGHIVDRLVSEGWSVRCLVRDMTRIMRLKKSGTEIVSGDLSSASNLIEACKDIDVVFHAAAKVSDWGEWIDFYKNTVIGTKNILQASCESQVKKFVHISSVDVYDRQYLKAEFARVNEDTPQVNEKYPYYYARAKMLAEKEVYYYRGIMPTVVIRPATVYGPRDRAIMPKFIDFLQGFSFLIAGKNPVLGMIHVDDLVDLCFRAATSQGSNGHAYNAATKEDTRLLDLVSAACDFLNISPPKMYLPYWSVKLLVILSESFAKIVHREPLFSQGAFEFFTLDQRFDITKAQNEFDWQPKVGFSNGIRQALEEFQREGGRLCTLR